MANSGCPHPSWPISRRGLSSSYLSISFSVLHTFVSDRFLISGTLLFSEVCATLREVVERCAAVEAYCRWIIYNHHQRNQRLLRTRTVRNCVNVDYGLWCSCLLDIVTYLPNRCQSSLWLSSCMSEFRTS